MSCCSKSATGLDCDRNDEYSYHMSFLHRNEEAQLEWHITPEDKARWGVVPKVKKVTKEIDDATKEASDEGNGST